MEKKIPVFIFVTLIALIVPIQCEDAQKKDGGNTTLDLLLYIDPTTGQMKLDVTLRNLYKEKITSKSQECYQSKKPSIKSSANIINVETVDLEQHSDIYASEKLLYPFRLKVRREGPVWCICKYGVGARMLVKTSNVEFFFQEYKHFLVVILNQTNVTVDTLQDKIGKGVFKVRQLTKKANVFHLISDNSTTYKIRLQQVQKILQNKFKPPLLVKDIRSTVACPPIEKYKIPSTDLPFNASLALNIDKYCVGEFETGAYWDYEKLNATNLQDLLRKQRVMSTSYSAIDSKDVIQGISENLDSIAYWSKKK